MEIVFKRRLINELLTTYLPSFLLLLISYATTFFKPFYFEAAVTVNLTVMLVTTTLFVRLVSIIILFFATVSMFISNVVFPVWWGSFRPLPTFVWWTFGSYLDNSSPLLRNDQHSNNMSKTSPIYFENVPHLFYIFRLFSSQLLSFITKMMTVSIIMDSLEMFPRTRGGSQNRSRMWQR